MNPAIFKNEELKVRALRMKEVENTLIHKK